MTKTWIVYKAESMGAEGWEQRRLMPSNTGTDILWENWDFSDKLPQPGDRIREYGNPLEASNGITHSKQGNWVVTRIEHFSSFDSNDRIVICYCQYQPVEADWQPLRRGRSVPELLEGNLTAS